jgi:hypothetical protein
MKNLCLLLLVLPLILGSSLSGNEMERITFKIKGTGAKRINVTIGIGDKPGNGSCCTGVSYDSRVSFTGTIGDVVYDGKTRRVITKIYKELEGTTIDLEAYY